MPENGAYVHPPRIIVCAVEGDWIEWKRDHEPEPGDCPFPECDCTPTLYEAALGFRPGRVLGTER